MAHPWFEPLHRRVLTLVFCLGWLVFELYIGESFWLVIAGLFCCYAAWDFFLSGNYSIRRSK